MTSVVFKLNRVRERLFQIGNLRWKLVRIAASSLPLNAQLFYYWGVASMHSLKDPGAWVSKSNDPGVFWLCLGLDR